VVELTGADMTDGLRFESLGRHRVRDLPGWTEIFQLCGSSMDRDFPSLVTLDTGLPPVTTIVYLDAIGPSHTARTWNPGEIQDALGNLVDVFATTFSSSGGQYLKQLGDGCIALFADPDAAIAFARAARTAASGHDISLRCAVHVGRVEFIHEEPVGTLLLATAALVRRAPPDRIALSSTAGALLSPDADLVILD
jgi:class 3 adenylate cyclase